MIKKKVDNFPIFKIVFPFISLIQTDFFLPGKRKILFIFINDKFISK